MSSTVTLPLLYQIVNGQSIDANPVMGDLNYIAAQVNSNAMNASTLASNSGAGLVGTASGISVQQALVETLPTGGSTSSRPVSPVLYQLYFDTTLGFPVWCISISPNVWVDAAGVTV